MDWIQISQETFIPELPKYLNENFASFKRYIDVFYDENRSIIIKPITTTGLVKGSKGEFVTAVVDNLVVKNQYTNLYGNITTADESYYQMYTEPAFVPRDPCTYGIDTSVWNFPYEPTAYKVIDVNKPYYKIDNTNGPIYLANENLSQVVGFFFADPSGPADYEIVLDPCLGSTYKVDASDGGSAYMEFIAKSFDASWGSTWVQYKYGADDSSVGGGGGDVGPGTIGTIPVFGPTVDAIEDSPLTISGGVLNTGDVDITGSLNVNGDVSAGDIIIHNAIRDSSNNILLGYGSPLQIGSSTNYRQIDFYSGGSSPAFSIYEDGSMYIDGNLNISSGVNISGDDVQINGYVKEASLGFGLYWVSGQLDVSVEGGGGGGDVTASTYTDNDLAVWSSTAKNLEDTAGKLTWDGTSLLVKGSATENYLNLNTGTGNIKIGDSDVYLSGGYIEISDTTEPFKTYWNGGKIFSINTSGDVSTKGDFIGGNVTSGSDPGHTHSAYVTSVTGGTGISSTGGTTPSVALTVNELSEKSGTLVATDRLVGTSGTTNFAETISGIPLSIFNNDSGWTSNTGTISGVTAGTGLSGGGSSGSISLALDFNELGVGGTLVGTDYLVAENGGVENRQLISSIPLSIFNNDLGWASGDVTASSYTDNDLAVWSSTAKNLEDTAGKLTWNGTSLGVTGTLAATTVTGANVTSGANPGHTHTGSSISALDAGDITTGTLPVSRGGTGTTTFVSNGVLTGNGTSAIQSESNLIFDSVALRVKNSGTENVRITATGQIDADGDVIAYSAIVSDIRLKENIEPLENSLDKILQLEGISYDRKSNGDHHIGFIAQEVEKVIPEVIHETPLPLQTDGDEETIYKTIRYTEIIPYLVEGMKKQQNIIDLQLKKIEDLENKFKELESVVNKILE